MSFESIDGSAGGWCDSKRKRIVVDDGRPVNAQVRVLVHECIHALGVDYQRFTREQAEVIVDTTTLIVLGGVGLDVSGETIPYVAGWGEDGALDAVTEFAQLIDSLARQVETALAGTDATPGAVAEPLSQRPPADRHDRCLRRVFRHSRPCRSSQAVRIVSTRGSR